MTDLQRQFEATGYTSWINSDLYPDGKIYTQEYTQWLEKRVQELSMPGITKRFNLLSFIAGISTGLILGLVFISFKFKIK